MINRKLSVRLCTGLMFAGFYNAAEASTNYNWTCQSGNWNNAACWSPNGLPSNDGGGVSSVSTPGYEATIDAGSGNASAYFLAVDNSATVRQTGGAVNTDGEFIADWGAGSYIQTGGTNTTRALIIGFSKTASGDYLLSGPSSVLNASYLEAGRRGVGVLNIEAGGVLNSLTSWIGLGDQLGYPNAAAGTVRVSGSGSRWTNGNDLSIGGDALGTDNSRGALNIDSGGVVSSKLSKLGVGARGIGTATVSGSGSQWVNSDYLTVGDSGTGTLNIDSGAAVGNVDGYIGRESGGSGTASVSNGGHWENTGSLTVGRLGTGVLNIDAGGLVSSADGYIGRESNANGSAKISSAGSHWNISGNLSVGYFGTGGLTIETGGLVSTSSAYIGDKSGSRGQVAVNGAGSRWNISEDLRVGEQGEGTLDIASGGVVNTNLSSIGVGVGTIGSANVSGNGSQWNTSGALTIGYQGTGILNITSGGVVNNNGYAFIGSSGGNGYVAIGGAGSQWNSYGNFYVGGGDNGAGGTADVTVTAGGEVNVAGALKVWDTGRVNMRGGTINAYTMTSEGALNFTAGKLNIASDLILDALGSAPGVALSELGAINVAGTTLLRGAGILALEGGTLTTGSLVNNGGFIFNRGTLNLTKDDLLIGNGGLLGGMVELKSGQTVNVSNTTRIDSGSVLVLNNGSLNAGTVNNQGRIVMDGYLASLGGGTLNNSGLVTGSGQINASLNNAGGEIRGNAGDTLVFTGAGNSNASRISLLGGSLDFNQGLTNKTTGQITGHGTLSTGSTMATGLANQGSLALNGDSEIIGDVNNTGRIVVSAGSTATFHDDVIHNGSEIKVSAGSQAVFFGNVSGAGRYTGTGATFFEGGFNPGNSPALVSFSGDMTLGEFSLTTLELGGLERGSEYDAFDVAGDLSVNGALNIALYDLGDGMFSPKLGDTFDLFTAESITGGFDFVTYAALGNGLGWHLDYLTDFVGSTDYVRLSVVSSVPLPAGVWLFGSGLAGLIAIRRR